ncbi:MAG: hypothetical protein LWW79_10025 [Holophagaceae bacterium]|nr:hypothetical protein [Holophagaceae bacterium]
MPAPSAPPTPTESLKELLSVLKIRKLIAVEDQRSTTTLPQEVENPIFFVAYCRKDPDAASAIPEFESIEFSDSFDSEEVTATWDQIPAARRAEIWAGVPEEIKRGLFEPVDSIGLDGAGPLEEGKLDVPASRELKGFVEEMGCEFRELSLDEWNRDEATILASTGTEPTLLLFDLDLSRDGGTDKQGAVLLKRALAAPGAMCALITHNALVGSERELASDLSQEFEIPVDRLLVISKKHLLAETPKLEQLATDLRTVALSSRLGDLKDTVSRILRTAFDKTFEEMDGLSPHAFEQIVFTSSRAEGVWESDTLLRVFAVLMGKRARAELRLDPALHQTIQLVREVNSVIRPLGVTSEARRIHAEEIYESPDLLNGSHSPLELGDVFRITINGQTRYYILIAQPCDLMLRPDGVRKRDLDKVPFILTRVRNLSKIDTNHSQFVHLTYFDPPKGTEFFAHFAEVIYVDPAILDLCTMNTDGAAKINLAATIDGLLLESQLARAAILKSAYQKRIQRLSVLGSPTGVPAAEKTLMAFEGVGWKTKTPPTINGHEIQYPIVRVKRLNQPRSGDLLLRFAQYHSRNAFEHDLDREITS